MNKNTFYFTTCVPVLSSERRGSVGESPVIASFAENDFFSI